ncbi:NAD(P)H-binding protein [Agromyces sp. CFH 90414]|uniref:NAD(P)H-binding protein n=1 Tax=Agromyces agglutinans TaxID=2662258 RepID=A0A6I2FA92_9MICO|nr:SDR family oxidoreductase [Agromyces agglutinans]MRG60727.1 NAD(P)H-binding protein [Agromyces agglutinans]
MANDVVFVTGATGIVGGGVARSLLERGVPVVAAVRSEADAARLPEGVVARRFEFGMAPAEIELALAGCDRLFLMRPPAIEDVRTFLFPVIDAAKRRGIRQIVFLSLQGVQANRKTPHHAVEQYLRETDAPYTSLRPNFFMQNLSTTYAAEIRDHDEIFVPAGRSFTAFIDAEDIGRVAAAVFTSPGHIRKAYTLSGEQSLTYSHVARILTDVLGRGIRYARPSEGEYLARLEEQGAPADYLAVQKMIYRVVRFNVSAFPNRMVRKLTGRPATTFREFAERERRVWERPAG